LFENVFVPTVRLMLLMVAGAVRYPTARLGK